MTGVIAEVPEPASTRPGFQLHTKRLAIRSFIERTHHFEYGFEHDVDGRSDFHVLYDFQRLYGGWLHLGSTRRHDSSPSSPCEIVRVAAPAAMAFCSARSLIRSR